MAPAYLVLLEPQLPEFFVESELAKMPDPAVQVLPVTPEASTRGESVAVPNV
ncbi:MAG: hypothetical protein AAGC57_19010 [Pseudomonadota bacterium]